jgi:hypothetical protein
MLSRSILNFPLVKRLDVPQSFLDAVRKITLLPLPEIELSILVTTHNFLIRALSASAFTPHDLTTICYAIPSLRLEPSTLWPFPRAGVWRRHLS